jgi:predicted deacylase
VWGESGLSAGLAMDTMRMKRIEMNVIRRKLLKPAFLLVALCACAHAQQREAFTVGTVTAQVGEKAHGFITVPAGVDEGTTIPVTVVRGARPGPTLALVAGVHGSEYAPIVALQRLLPRLDPKDISGTIVLVHVANIPSFLKRTIYYGPVDGKNLNRVFPGDPRGTVTERIAHALVEEVFRRADYVIDVHCGDGNEALVPYVVYYSDPPDPKLLAPARELALAFGIEYVKAASGRPRDFRKATYSTNAAMLMGKVTIAVESGELARTDEESVGRIERGALSVMRHLRMLAGEPEPVKDPIMVDRDETVRSRATGIFYPSVRRGAAVKAGQALGHVTDLFGRQVMEARAPFDGVVMFVLGTPPVSEGEPLANVARIAKPDAAKSAVKSLR